MSKIMEPLTDLELIEEVAQRNARRFTELMRRIGAHLWAARRILGDHADADERHKETFVKAFLNWESSAATQAFFTGSTGIANQSLPDAPQAAT